MLTTMPNYYARDMQALRMLSAQLEVNIISQAALMRCLFGPKKLVADSDTVGSVAERDFLGPTGWTEPALVSQLIRFADMAARRADELAANVGSNQDKHFICSIGPAGAGALTTLGRAVAELHNRQDILSAEWDGLAVHNRLNALFYSRDAVPVFFVSDEGFRVKAIHDLGRFGSTFDATDLPELSGAVQGIEAFALDYALSRGVPQIAWDAPLDSPHLAKMLRLAGERGYKVTLLHTDAPLSVCENSVSDNPFTTVAREGQRFACQMQLCKSVLPQILPLVDQAAYFHREAANAVPMLVSAEFAGTYRVADGYAAESLADRHPEVARSLLRKSAPTPAP